MPAVGRPVIAFDVMDTLLGDTWTTALEAATGLTIAEINQRQDVGMWHALERGAVSEAEYWLSLREHGVRVDVPLFHEVRRRGYDWLPGAAELVSELRAAGHRVVLASNYPDWIEEVAAAHPAAAGVPLYASYRLGVRKPAREFFEPVLHDYEADWTDLLLVDDNAANVASVLAAGGRGVQHTDTDATRSYLQANGIL